MLNRTKETFVDGWVHTGDEVVINDKLEVFVVDRLKVRNLCELQCNRAN